MVKGRKKHAPGVESSTNQKNTGKMCRPGEVGESKTTRAPTVGLSKHYTTKVQHKKGDWPV